MCFHSPGCSRNTGTFLSGRFEINQRARGQGGEQIKAECAFIFLVVPETQELFCEINQRARGQGGEQIKAECAFILLVF